MLTITLPRVDHIGGVPYQGPERRWYEVTMKHDTGVIKFRVFAGDEERAAHKVCARELAPRRAAIKIELSENQRDTNRLDLG